MTDQPIPAAADHTPEAVSRVLTEEIADQAAAPLPNPGSLAPIGNVGNGSGIGVPSAAAPPSLASAGSTLRLDPAEEYVAGAGYTGGVLSYARSLPDYIDDLTADFGADLYERMELDAHIAGELNFFKSSVLGNGIRLLPAFPPPARRSVGVGSGVAQGPDLEAQRRHDIASEVMDFCQRCLDELSTPLRPVLRDLLGAFALGNRVAEIVYRWEGDALVPDRIAVKPRSAVGYVVDSRGRTIGLLGAIAGQPQIMVRPGLIISPKDTPNLLPRRKFAIASWWTTNGDPRGTSVLRPAYNAWWQKRQTEVELAKFITQFAGSSLFATIGEKSQPVQLENRDGTLATDAAGRPIMLSPSAALRNVLVQMRNGGVGVGPFGTDVKNIVAVGAGQPFFDQIARCDADMSKAILGTAMATNDSDKNGSRAAITSHKDCVDLIVAEGEDTIEEMIRTDILRECVRLNYGEAYLPFVPKVSLGAVEEADLGALSTGFAAIGYEIAPSQLPEADSMLGFTPRTDEEVAQAASNAANAANANAATASAAAAASKSLSPGNNDREEDADGDGDESDDEDSKFTVRTRRWLSALFSQPLGSDRRKKKR